MKKIIALALALVMLAAMSVTAFAAAVDQDSENKSQGVLVKYGPSATYNVTIPEGIDFGETLSATGEVIVSNVKISPIQAVKVTIASLSGTGAEVKAALSAATVTVTMEDQANKDAWTMIDMAGNSEAVPYEATSTVKLNTDETAQNAVDLTENNVVISVPGAQSGAATTATGGTATLAFTTGGTAQVGQYYDLLTFTVAVE